MLVDEIKLSQNGDESSTLEIIKRFKPLIRKYSNKIYYDDTESLFIISILNAIKKINIATNNSEGEIVKYFEKVIKNTYIDEVKKRLNNISNQACFENTYEIENIISYENRIEEIEFEIYLQQIISTLSKSEKKIINGLFIRNKSEIELAQEYSISKQAVSKTKVSACKKLKQIIEEEFKIWNQKYSK